MKRFASAVFAFAILVSSSTAYADSRDNPFQAFDFEALTVSTAAVGLTTSKFSLTEISSVTRRVMCFVESANVRMRLDGTAPTSLVGHILKDGDTIILGSYSDIANARWIRDDSTDATLACHFFN